MLHRALDTRDATDVGRHLTLLTLARTTANGCFRFAPPFLSVIASGVGVSLATIGVAVAVSELAGLLSPLTGAVAERFHRRTAMTAGLVGVAAAALLAAASTHVAVLALALVLLAQSKVLFDLGLVDWVSDRVPYERRGRVIGLTETSWALGLLVGVTSMGLLASVTSWRLAYVAGAIAVVVLAGLVRARVDDDPAHHRAERADRPPVRITRLAVVVACGTFTLMGTSQMLFVTFGSWLGDEFGFSAAGVAAVAFGLGFAELAASLGSARLADRWGKERAGAAGAMLMVPAALLLAAVDERLLFGLPLLVIAFAGFEFAVVSIIPLGTRMVPGAPAIGMSIILATGTLGRATASIPATSTYVRYGLTWPATMCAALAACTVIAMRLVSVVDRQVSDSRS
ncbi:MAG: MFS transporter [Ilumatobacteraceae bacterium]